LNKLRRYSLRRSSVLRSLASTGSVRATLTRRSVPDLRSAWRRSAPDRRSVVLRSIVLGIICPYRCPRHRQPRPWSGEVSRLRQPLPQLFEEPSSSTAGSGSSVARWQASITPSQC